MNSLLRKLSLSHSIKLDKKAAIKRFSPGKQRHLHTKRIQRNTVTELAGSFESSNGNLIHDTSPCSSWVWKLFSPYLIVNLAEKIKFNFNWNQRLKCYQKQQTFTYVLSRRYPSKLKKYLLLKAFHRICTIKKLEQKRKRRLNYFCNLRKK